jgi:beta-mannosidase
MTFTPLHTDWTVTAISGEAPGDLLGHPLAATVPGCAHTDLVAAGVIVAPLVVRHANGLLASSSV